MRILLTNDDGIHAPGLAVLERIARALFRRYLDLRARRGAIGAGHSLTLGRPVRLKQHDARRFSVSGTPTDAVTMALKRLLPAPPDLILSGVNRGANLGDDVTYSGTVSAAMEGALAGIRSIALSQVYIRENTGESVSFEASEFWGERCLPLCSTRRLRHEPWSMSTSRRLRPEEVKGIRVARQGFHDYARGSVVEGTDPRGFPYFWFGLHGIEHTPGHATDLEAIADGYVSVTPLQIDLTHEESLAVACGALRMKRARPGCSRSAPLLMAETTAPLPADQETVHVVKEGETIGGIAQRAKVPRVLIIEANGLQGALHRAHRAAAGHPAHAAATRSPRAIRALPIAYLYGVPWQEIAIANGIDRQMRRSRPGRSLRSRR